MSLMSMNSAGTNFEGDLKVLKRHKLFRNHEYSALIQVVEKFQQELKLSSHQGKDRCQLSRQWEDQQFYRILVKMMHEVSITTGMKQKQDLKKVYRWYHSNKSVLHSQPHFKGSSTKAVYKRPVLQFAPDALKYYSTPHEKRRQKRVAFDGDEKPSPERQRHQRVSSQKDGKEENLWRELSSEERWKGAGQRPVTAPAGLKRPKVTNNLAKCTPASELGTSQEDGKLTEVFDVDHASSLPSSPWRDSTRRPYSALGLDHDHCDLDSIDGDVTNGPTQAIQSPQLSVHVPDVNGQSDSPVNDAPGVHHDSGTSIASGDVLAFDTAASMLMRDNNHPIPSLVNPVARAQIDDVMRDEPCQLAGERSNTPAKMRMHVDIPTNGSTISDRVKTPEDIRAENLGKWHDFQTQQSYSQDVAAMQSFYGHGGLPTNVRYTSHEGGETPEFYTRHMIAGYASQMSTPQIIPHTSEVTDANTSLEQFYELSEKYCPKHDGAKRAGKYGDGSADRKLHGSSDETSLHLGNGLLSSSPRREKTVKFESVVDLANQVGDQLTRQKEKLTPEPRHGYRQPMLRLTPAAQCHSPRQATSPPSSLTYPRPSSSEMPKASVPAAGGSPKVLFAPPNSSQQSTASSGDFTPRNKKGDPIVLLPDFSQYTVHFRRNDRPPLSVPRTASRQGRVQVPDQQRYSRASSAPGNRAVRAADSASVGHRPRTATEPSMRHERYKSKVIGSSIHRVPQAASHTTLSIAPHAVAAMMNIRHLGNERTIERMKMNAHGSYYLDEEYEATGPTLEYMSFTGPATLRTRAPVENHVSIPTDDSPLSDVSDHNPPSQPNESLPGQEWYRPGSYTGHAEGKDLPSLSEGCNDSEGTDDRSSLSQDMDDIDMMLDQSVDQSIDQSIDRSTDQSIDRSTDQSIDRSTDQPIDHLGSLQDHNDLNIGREASCQPEIGVDHRGTLNNNLQDTVSQGGLVKDSVTVEEENLAESCHHEDGNERGKETPRSCIREDTSQESRSSPDSVSFPEQAGTNGISSEGGTGDGKTQQLHNDLSHPNGGDSGYHIQAIDDEQTRQAVTRRPKSASPRLGTVHKDGSNNAKEEERPAPATEGSIPSVFTIEIDGSQENPSPGAFHTVPIAYMALSDEHRGQLQHRVIPLVDQQRPHFMGQQHHSMSPEVTKKPLTPRDSSRNSPMPSTRTSEYCVSPTPSQDHSTSQHHQSNCLCAELARLQQMGCLESTVTNLMKQMTSSSASSEPWLTEEGQPPEPPASLVGDDRWSEALGSFNQHFLLPPQIQVQRPNSAPSSTSSTPRGSVMSRRTSASLDRTPRPRANTDVSFEADQPARPRSGSSVRGKEWRGRPLPSFGPAKDVEEQKQAVTRAQAAKSAVNIRELFGGSTAKEYRRELEKQERERWEKLQRDNRNLNKNFRDYLMRKQIALVQHPDIFNKDWARGYLSDKMFKDRMRQDKWNEHMRQQAIENRKALGLLKRIGPSVDIWELFHGSKRGVTKVQMKRAAITIQKYIRGWIVRTMLEKVKQKSRVHSGSFKSFVKLYGRLMKRIARWHGVKKPLIHLDLWQMDEFMDRKRYYEYVFAKRAHPSDSIRLRDLEGFFKECDHFPSKREIFGAITGATKKDGKNLETKFTEKEVVEITFMIYVPQGSNLKLKDTRKSTWLNPLVDGKEAKKLMGSDEVEKVEYAKSLQVVFAAFQERREKEEAAKALEKKREAELATSDSNEK